MAFQQRRVLPNTGVDLGTAYIRIEDATLPTLKGAMQVQLSTYVNQAAARSGLAPVEHQTIMLTDAQVAQLRTLFCQQVYGFLKVMPQFAGAIDIFDPVNPE